MKQPVLFPLVQPAFSHECAKMSDCFSHGKPALMGRKFRPGQSVDRPSDAPCRIVGGAAGMCGHCLEDLLQPALVVVDDLVNTDADILSRRPMGGKRGTDGQCADFCKLVM